jgi:hypothetical protein
MQGNVTIVKWRRKHKRKLWRKHAQEENEELLWTQVGGEAGEAGRGVRRSTELPVANRDINSQL